MQEGLNNNQTPANNINTPVVPQKENEQKLKIVQTDEGQKNDLYRCPKCGATEISLNPNTGKLRCSFCRHEFDYEKPEGLDQDIKNLEGIVMGSGTQDIVADTKDVMTFKCSSCGAEVVIDTSSSLQARCHWCRNTLSLNQQIPNGAVPDVVLPFSVTKDIAKEQIEKFVGKRRFFAAKRFQEEFTTQNIMGVYFPYMVIDVNAHAKLVGQGEHLVRSYRRSVGNRDVTYYDADLYDVGREFDVTIDDLTVESSKDKLDKKSETKTNNIINAIMPFDTENAVKWNANYIKGFSSEKRDTNVSDLAEIATAQAKDVVIHSANVTLDLYFKHNSSNFILALATDSLTYFSISNLRPVSVRSNTRVQYTSFLRSSLAIQSLLKVMFNCNHCITIFIDAVVYSVNTTYLFDCFYMF